MVNTIYDALQQATSTAWSRIAAEDLNAVSTTLALPTRTTRDAKSRPFIFTDDLEAARVSAINNGTRCSK